jgi:hypothetical protein
MADFGRPDSRLAAEREGDAPHILLLPGFHLMRETTRLLLGTRAGFRRHTDVPRYRPRNVGRCDVCFRLATFSLPASSIVILQSLDVVLVETLAVLHLDEHQILGARVLDTVRVATADRDMSAGRK